MRSARILSYSLPMHEVRLIGLYDANTLADLRALSRGMMMACLHCCGHMPFSKKRLKMSRSSCLAIGPSAWRKVGGMSSGPHAPFVFIFPSALSNSYGVKGTQLPSVSSSFAFGARIMRLSWSLSRRSSFRNLRRLTLA